MNAEKLLRDTIEPSSSNDDNLITDSKGMDSIFNLTFIKIFEKKRNHDTLKIFKDLTKESSS